MKKLILDLDGTLVRLQTDWGAVKALVDGEIASLGVSVLGGLDQKFQYLRETHPEMFFALLPRVARLECVGLESAPVNSALVSRVLSVGLSSCAVFSMNCRETVVRAVELCLGSVPSVVVCKDDLLLPKPAGEGVLTVLRLTGWAASDCVMIGDTDKDRGAALAAGVEFELVRW